MFNRTLIKNLNKRITDLERELAACEGALKNSGNVCRYLTTQNAALLKALESNNLKDVVAALEEKTKEYRVLANGVNSQ